MKGKVNEIGKGAEHKSNLGSKVNSWARSFGRQEG